MLNEGFGSDGALIDTLIKPRMVVINYGFKQFLPLRRIGNDNDLEALSNTFQKARGYDFHLWNAPEKSELIKPDNLEKWLFSNLKLSSSSDPDIPAIFFVILSHGGSDGKIFTEKLIDETRQPSAEISAEGFFEYFTNIEFFQALKELHWLKHTLKILCFGPCRGPLLETIDKSQQQTQIKNVCHLLEPNTQNFVILYATVAETLATREEHFNAQLKLEKGTWMVHAMCQVMDNLKEDSTLENVLTRVKLKIHQWTLEAFKGQTPEVKYYPHKKLVFKKLTSTNDGTPGNLDKLTNYEKIETIPDRDIFYDWKSKDGSLLYKRLGMIICNAKSRAVLKMEQALSNKGFDLILLALDKDADSYNKSMDTVTLGEDDKHGCVLICIFTSIGSEGQQVSEENEEITFTMSRAQITLKTIIGRFTDKKCTKWIGKPKIFLFLDESTTHDFFNPMDILHQENMMSFERDATKNSGILVFVGCGSGMTEKVTQLLSSSRLQTGGNILEELTQIIRDGNFCRGKPTVMPHLTSTLPHFLDLPKVGDEVFVEPELLTQIRPETTYNWVEFKSMIVDEQSHGAKHDLLGPSNHAEGALSLKNHAWLLFANAGMGKSAAIDNLAHWVKWNFLDHLVVHIKLQKYNSILKREPQQPGIFKFICYSLSCSEQEEQLAKFLGANKVIIFMDGFDELFAVHKNKVIEVMKSIEAKMPFFITTRPQDRSMIKNALPSANLTEMRIQPWTDDQQLQFMCQFTMQSEEKCSKKLANFYSKERLGSLLKIPFFIKNIDFDSLEDIVAGNVFNLFTQIAKRKIEFEMIHKEKKSPEDEEFDEFFREREILIQKATLQYYNDSAKINFSAKEKIKVKKTGLVVIDDEDDSISFIHQLFAEYFVARYFIECILDSNYGHDLAPSCGITLNMILVDNKYEYCRYFIEAFFQDECNNKKFSNIEKLLPICGLTSTEASLEFMNTICTEGLDQCYTVVSKNAKQFKTCEQPQIWNNAEMFKENFKHFFTTAYSAPVTVHQENIILILIDEACKFYQTDKFVEDVLMGIFSQDEQVDFLNFVSYREYKKVVEKVIKGTTLIKSLIDAGKVTELRGLNFVMDVNILRLYLANGLEINLNKYVGKGEPSDTLLESSVTTSSDLCFNELLTYDEIKLQISSNKLNLLHRAATHNRLSVLKTLLDGGYIDNNEIMRQDFQGYSPLHCAVQYNSYKNAQTECLKYLATKNKEALYLKDHMGFNVLQLSAEKGNTEGIRICIEFGMNKNDILDIFDYVLTSKQEVTEYLIEEKIFLPNHRDKRGATFIHHIIGFCSLRFYDKIIKCGADVHTKCSMTIKQLLYNIKFHDTVDLIFNSQSQPESELPFVDNVSVLHIVALRKDAWDEFEYFIAKGVNVLDEDSLGRTVLDWAVYKGEVEVIEKLLHCTVAAVTNISELMSKALVALISNDKNAYCELLSQGVNVNQKYFNGITALHLACLKSDLGFLKFLLEKGADVNAVDKNDWSPVFWAAQFGSAEFFNFVLNISSKETHNRLDIFGCNILHVALVRRNEFEIIKIAKEKVHDVNCKNLFGLTAIHYASSYFHPSLLTLVLELEGIDVNAKTNTGCTALHIAANLDFWWHINLLRGVNANYEMQNNDGLTPLDVAKQKHSFKSVLRLQEWMEINGPNERA